MTLSFHPRPTKAPRKSVPPDRITAWGRFLAAALGGLAAVLTAFGAIGSGCVQVKASNVDGVTREISALREEMSRERVSRDRELREMREDIKGNAAAAKFAADKATANEVSIESHHPKVTFR